MNTNEAIIKFSKNDGIPLSKKVELIEELEIEELPFVRKLSFQPILRYWKKQLDGDDLEKKILAKEIFNQLEKRPQFSEPFEDVSLNQEESDFVKLLLSGFLSEGFNKDNLSAAYVPFTMRHIIATSAMDELLSSPKTTLCFNLEKEVVKRFIIIKACIQILNQHYNQNVKVDPSFIYTLEEDSYVKKNHFKIELFLDFVDVVPIQSLKKLSKKEINQMLSNIYDVNFWLKMLPPENFEFHGIAIERLFDITEEETVSRLKFQLLESDALLTQANIKALELNLKTYFKIPELRFGITALDYPAEMTIPHKYKIRYNFLAKKYESIIYGENKNSLYQSVCQWKEDMIFEDLKDCKREHHIVKDLVAEGIGSIIICPLIRKDGQVIGILEIGAPGPFQLTSFEKIKLRDILPLFNMAMERSREEVDNKIEAILLEEYTTIHPSVAWKFVDGAFKLMEHRETDPTFSEVETIAFENVYPLYGQADIVGSSNRRNQCIQSDLLTNLGFVKNLLTLAQEYIFFPLLDKKLLQVEKNIQSLQKGITSDEESRLIEFIRNDIHPILNEIKNKHPELDEKLITYFSQLDPVLGIIYKDRKRYEKSVAKIVETISDCLMSAEKYGQQMIPHYFNEYKTDGVEYDIYVGQSILKNGSFNDIHLKNLRLWQLLLMAKITKEVHDIKPNLPTPLDTAQLIFVYGNPLSIRYRMDEKRFDVDGAYNVRYEIIKKRIDKAYIEGTDERLTVKGKIAIVYTSEKDKAEYLEYLNYMKEKELITGEIEDLNLSKMQGVDGLRALRVTVAV